MTDSVDSAQEPDVLVVSGVEQVGPIKAEAVVVRDGLSMLGWLSLRNHIHSSEDQLAAMRGVAAIEFPTNESVRISVNDPSAAVEVVRWLDGFLRRYERS